MAYDEVAPTTGNFAMKLTLHLLHDDRPTGPRIAKLADILKAKTLDDVFSK
jgi:hypothetical protein